MTSKALLLWACLLAVTLTVACGSGTWCLSVVTLSPDAVTANSSTVGGNTVTFKASQGSQGPYCPLTPQIVGTVDANWTSSDNTNVRIINAKTAIGTDGVATCLNPTPTPAVITATSPEGKKATATLTCQ